MIRAYGWRAGCPAAGVTDAGVGSGEWFGIDCVCLEGAQYSKATNTTAMASQRNLIQIGGAPDRRRLAIKIRIKMNEIIMAGIIHDGDFMGFRLGMPYYECEQNCDA
jgi:hypothetical protein